MSQLVDEGTWKKNQGQYRYDKITVFKNSHQKKEHFLYDKAGEKIYRDD
jgi:hypothetical protein